LFEELEGTFQEFIIYPHAIVVKANPEHTLKSRGYRRSSSGVAVEEP
jgi:hypothetical protein